jgi:trimethylamine-N-oxide reductase (cytochrome c)
MNFVRYAGFRADPLFEPLGTPSGLIEIYSRTIERMGYEGCPPHPTWIEPDEWSDKAGEYPLHVNTSHPDSRLHSQLNGTILRDGYAVAGREPCLINPEDAAARGIADGDVVRVFNDRGQILAGAQISDAIRPGVIRVNEGGWYDPVVGGEVGTLCAYGDVNQLTGDVPTSRLANGNSGHTCRGNVEKYTGELPEVKVFSAPTNA